ncbi:MAG: hypothetical protein KKA54_17270 [Proteobacteria bacterium]|nr:hypothetical protein [Pseudomonadota bacterium]
MDSDLISSHMLLVTGQSYESCRDNVLRFFHNTILVKYDRVDVIAEESVSALQDEFKEKLAEGMGQNRQRVQQLLGELRHEGFGDLGKWLAMPQGYPSKTVHEIAHLLDGFFGIDSAFYNLIDDSHWVSDTLLQEIGANPQRYWLIRADGRSQVANIDRVPFLRRLGKE